MDKAAARPGDLAEFAADLRELRVRQNFTYKELAEKTGRAPSTLTAAVEGTRLPNLSITLLWVRACGGSEEEWHQRWIELRSRLAYERDTRRFPAQPADRLRPEQVSTPAEFVAALRALWRDSGLTYSQVERASGGQLARSTLSDMLTGRTMPTWERPEAFPYRLRGRAAGPARA